MIRIWIWGILKRFSFRRESQGVNQEGKVLRKSLRVKFDKNLKKRLILIRKK